MKTRIKNPAHLRNVTFEDHIMSLDWTDESVAKHAQDIQVYEAHNVFCGEHGGSSVIDVSTKWFIIINFCMMTFCFILGPL